MGISASRINFLALTTVKRKVEINSQSEYDISAKVQSLAEEYQSLLNGASDVLNPFNIGDTLTIGSRVTSLLPDDTFIGKDGEELEKMPTKATVSSVNDDYVSLKVGDNVVSVNIDDLTTATDKTLYTPEEFLSLTGNNALTNINFDASSYIDYSVETSAQTTIFANDLLMASSVSANASSKNIGASADTIGAEHMSVNNEYNAMKSIIGVDNKKSLAFVG